MSNKTVNGFSDLTNRGNLTTNGLFRINQRGNFGSFALVAVNDYVADCWFCSTQQIDYCEAKQSVAGQFELQGYGRKGQQILFKNQDLESLGRGTTSLTESITAQVTVTSGAVSVPIQIEAYSRHYSPAEAILSSNFPIISPGKIKTAHSVRLTRPQTPVYEPFFKITLLADGEFYLTVHHFCEVAGAFGNPSTFAPVSYADDLQRCERYYQEGEVKRPSIPCYKVSTDMFGEAYISLRTRMESTPSVTFTPATNYALAQLSELGSNWADDPSSGWSTTAGNITDRGFKLRLSRTNVASRSIVQPDLSWIAEV